MPHPLIVHVLSLVITRNISCTLRVIVLLDYSSVLAIERGTLAKCLHNS